MSTLSHHQQKQKILPENQLDQVVENFRRDRAQKEQKWKQAVEMMRQVDMKRRQQTTSN